LGVSTVALPWLSHYACFDKWWWCGGGDHEHNPRNPVLRAENFRPK
jgi:hypothetical protein